MKNPTTLPTDLIQYHSILRELPGIWADNSESMVALVADMVAAKSILNKRKDHPSSRFPIGLRTASKILGYHPSHIARVVKGERISPPTLKAYNALVAKMEAGK